MDIRQLRYFVAVCRHGSMTAASRVVHVSQPALGEKLRQLEDELGVELLERHSRGVRPSAAGQTLHEHAERILTAIDEARYAVARSTDAAPLRLVIGLNPTASRLWSSDLLEALAPAARVTFREAMSQEIEADVAAGRLDAGFCYDPPAGRFDIHEVRREPLLLVGPPHLVKSSDDIRFDDLPQYALALDSSSNVLRSSLDSAARRRGIKLNVSYEAEPVVLKRRLLLHHRCCTVVPEALFGEEIAAGELVARRIVSPQIRRRLCLIVRHGLDRQSVRLLRTRLAALTAGSSQRARTGGSANRTKTVGKLARRLA